MNYQKFHTIVDIPKYNWQTSYGKWNMFIGSCFTENIGNRMESLKFNVDVNPFGILYNPMSVAASIKYLLKNKQFFETDLVRHGGLWHSFAHHGNFSANSANEVLDSINTRIEASAKFLQRAGFLFITFGTAWVYKYKPTGETVSNCHKIPASSFIRVRLTVDEIVNEYRHILSELRLENPNLKVIFTVSPIRHWGDGAIENQRSKSVLLLAIDKIISEPGSSCCTYFPAYEIVMDELRDYRFYAPDMIHISDVAVDYIWEKFEKALVDTQSQQNIQQVRKIIKDLNHRPLHSDSTEYNRFLMLSYKQILKLENTLLHIDLSAEKSYFEAELQRVKTL